MDTFIQQLAFLANTRSSIEEPFETNRDLPEMKTPEILEPIAPSSPDRHRTPMDAIDVLVEEGAKVITSVMSTNLVGDFDHYLDTMFIEDEDEEFRNQILQLGRKYARDTKQTKEESEIRQAFGGNELQLDQLIEEIASDKLSLQKDITNMRAMRTKNYRTVSELIETKASLHNTHLNAIKEKDKVAKDQLELRFKQERNTVGLGDNGNAEFAVQKLLQASREELSGPGWYQTVSGAIHEEDDLPDETILDPEFDREENNEDTEYEERFVEYEKLGVQMILHLEEDGSKWIQAEDREGNPLPDYPIPDTIENLHFQIDSKSGTATDVYHRIYMIRKEYDSPGVDEYSDSDYR